MFTEVELEWTVLVPPDRMKSSAHIQRAVILALLKDFNDVKCTAQHGYHVIPTTLEDIGEGRLWERRGCAAFPVRFRCVVFNVFKDEHVFAVVTEAQSSGVLCQCGPIEQLFISKKHMKAYEFLSTEVESLAVMKWRNTKNGATIRKGDVIRVKILGTQWEPAQRALSAAGSLLGHYAGVDDRWPEPKENPRQVDNSGWEEEPRTDGVTENGGWGESPTRFTTDNSGWEQPDMNGGNDNSGWGEPSTKDAEDNSGWEHPSADDIGASGWD